jgi:hypothetical protein
MQTIGLLKFLSKYHVKVIIETIQKKSKKITFFDEMIISFTPYFNSLRATYFELPTSINNHPNIFSNDHFNLQKRKELEI